MLRVRSLARGALASVPRAVRISHARALSEAPLHRLRGPAALPAPSDGAAEPAPSTPTTIAVPGFVVTAPHARVTAQKQDPSDYMLSHSVYTAEEVAGLKTDVHFQPAGPGDRLAKAAVGLMRGAFDAVTGYKAAPRSNGVSTYLTRGIFLETVAGVPGMVASMSRHFESLRLMRRDGGWIHTLLSEAENERMHLLTWLELKKPGLAFRAAVLLTQGVFFNVFFAAYIVAPSVCHRFVGFLEEEAVRTYTHIIDDLDAGKLPEWEGLAAPPIAIAYWRLPPTAVLRDVLLAIRADEAIHRDVNHVFGSLKRDAKSPFV